MRPINKGLWPTKGRRNLTKRVFNDWTNAIPFLKQRTGSYCHLCEMRVSNAIAIEHIKPKVSFPKLQNHWDNFLLICSSCNSHKKARIPVSPYRKNYFWPHLNNTLLVFEYANVLPHFKPISTLNNIERDRAKNLVDLYGLNKEITASGDADTRWIEKQKAYKMAIDRRIEYETGINKSIDSIIDLAIQSGFFSIWLKVFKDILPIRRALILCPEFHLANNNCFDNNLELQSRNSDDL
jgi:5-methylcytosine-specific restriction endonuclease McrA